ARAGRPGRLLAAVPPAPRGGLLRPGLAVRAWARRCRHRRDRPGHVPDHGCPGRDAGSWRPGRGSCGPRRQPRHPLDTGRAVGGGVVIRYDLAAGVGLAAVAALAAGWFLLGPWLAAQMTRTVPVLVPASPSPAPTHHRQARPRPHVPPQLPRQLAPPQLPG